MSPYAGPSNVGAAARDEWRGSGLLADLVASVLNATIRPSDGWRRRGAAVPSAAGPDRGAARAALAGRSRTGSEKFRAGS
ncbi:hypothetical protein E0F15_03800 [Frankia sp. B2]|uniref:hypothetical protein n=1 Tax=unclassified Frankia TaxID=2632575 RepID=UPI000A7AE70D|nr:MULTISPECIES: hypothetical protein [unclassified Frankia]TFE34018.1 hypothetical protein E0F15_03800 [Frankia sp. B2]